MKRSLTIGWLYPDLMSTYGDRGNIISLKRRCEWRGISVEVISIEQDTQYQILNTVNLLFGGGAQDREQEIVMRDLRKHKGKIIKELIEHDVPALFVCGSPQLMGKLYEPAVGEEIEGLGIFDMETRNPGPQAPRLIGNIVAEVAWQNLLGHPGVPPSETIGSHLTDSIASPRSMGMNVALLQNDKIIVGFENHGGRTYLGKNALPFAKVIKGHGNNGTDGTEGVLYKNAIGCYFHGPLLPKNPSIADWLIQTALTVKYKEEIELEKLDDSLEEKAQQVIAKRMKVSI